MRKFRTSWRITAIVIALALIAQLSIWATGEDFKRTKALGDGNDGQEPGTMQIAADISNMSGVPVDEVLRLRQAGLSWDETLERLKNADGKTGDGRAMRQERLSGSGMGEEAMASLSLLGYSDLQIAEAKLIAERVGRQIAELAEPSMLAAAPEPEPATALSGNLPNDDESRQAVYRELAERFALEEAVRTILTLAEKLGGYEPALDEYIQALQLDLDIHLLSTDEQAYAEQKEQAMIGMRPDELIRLHDIELDLLDRIRSDGNAVDDMLQPDQSSAGMGEAFEQMDDDPMPDVPMPVIEDVRPVNPTQAILDEIAAINPNR